MADNDCSATIKSRVESLTSENVVGLSVSEVRSNFGSVLNIPANSSAVVDGEIVGEDYVVGVGDIVRFSLATGEKG